MSAAETPLLFPVLGGVYQLLAPWAEALLRAFVGLALVPHGLRNTFGMWPATGVRSHNLTELAALGLFTRLAAIPIVLFLIVSNFERWRVGGYFWNKTGLEYTLMWTLAALYFLVHGGGTISLDHLLLGREF
jgi:putative oxidoreductase